MKKQIMFMVALAIAMILAGAVAMADVTVGASLLGSETQLRGENVSTSFQITNTGSSALNNIVIASSASSKYQIGFEDVPSSLAAGASATVTVTGHVPLDFNAVDNDGNKMAFKIGTITVTGDTGTGSADLSMEAKDMLIIRRMTVYVDDKSDSVGNDDRVKDIKPGSDIKVTVRMDNKFSESGSCTRDGTNCDFQDVSGDLVIDENDIDESDTFDFGDIDAGAYEEDSISFTIDPDVSDDTYNMDVTVTETDDNGALHGDHFTVRLEVVRQDHEIDFTSFSMDPETLQCNQREATLTARIKNTGRDDEDSITLDVEQRKLDILETIPMIQLDQDESITKTFDLTLPSNMTPGSYYFDLIAYVDGDTEVNREPVKLTILPCQSTTTPPDNTGSGTGSTTVTPITEVHVIPPITGNVISTPTQSTGFTGTKEYVLLLVVGVFIVLLLIVLEVTLLLRK